MNKSTEKGAAVQAALSEVVSLRHNHMGSPSVREQGRAIREATLAWHLRNNEGTSDEQIAEKLKYGSVDALRKQFESWGLPGWIVGGEVRRGSPRRARAAGTARPEKLPPAARARALFESAVERLREAIDVLPRREDRRQDGRFVLHRNVPLSESLSQEDGPGYGHLVAPPGAQPNEHGAVRFTMAEAYSLQPAGAARYPDELETALIGSALLVGISPDRLMNELHPSPSSEVLQEIHKKLEGKDGLKARASQIASLMRGGTAGQGSPREPVTAEEHAAAWFIAEHRQYGTTDPELLHRLRNEPTLLRETKKHRQITLADVKRLGSLKLQAFSD